MQLSTDKKDKETYKKYLKTSNNEHDWIPIKQASFSGCSTRLA